MCKVYSNIEYVGSWNFKTQIFHRYEKTCLVHSSSRKSERMIKYLVYSMHAIRPKEYSISLKKKYEILMVFTITCIEGIELSYIMDIIVIYFLLNVCLVHVNRR
jgi:IS30 family transposase